MAESIDVLVVDFHQGIKGILKNCCKSFNGLEFDFTFASTLAEGLRKLNGHPIVIYNSEEKTKKGYGNLKGYPDRLRQIRDDLKIIAWGFYDEEHLIADENVDYFASKEFADPTYPELRAMIYRAYLDLKEADMPEQP